MNSKYISKELSITQNTENLLLRSEGKDRAVASMAEVQEYALLFGHIPHATAVVLHPSGFDGRRTSELFANKENWFLFKEYNAINLQKKDEYPYAQLWVDEEKKMMITISLNVIDKSAHGYWSDPLANLTYTPDRGLTDFAEDETALEKYHLTITDITILHPPKWSGDYNKEHILQTASLFETIVRNTEKDPKIGVISSSQGDYYVKDFSLKGKIPEMIEMDLHYGEGFTEFHSSLIERLNGNTKGLVLFHGDPGTGKTHYIRYLLGELTKIDKTVIYFSPGMAQQITSPDMMNFLSTWIAEKEKDCIILIEDAEPLLQTRTSGSRSEGITNLLNMTDGILNDMLGVTVIATFNIQIEKIDTALLRPERLIARKWFTKIPWEQGKKLLEVLKMGKRDDISWPASIAEIYSKKKENEILQHGTETKKNNIGFKS